MAVLLLADVVDGKLATDQVAKALTAVKSLGPVTVLVAGPDAGAAAAEAATLDGVARVLLAEDAAYAPYLLRQESELRDLRAADHLSLGDGFPYADIPGLSREMVERLTRARPETLAAAGRIAGITPAALTALLMHIRRRAA